MADVTPEQPLERWRAWVRLALFAVLVLGVGGAFVASGGRASEALSTIRTAIDGTGAWAPVLFVVVYALLTMLLVPGAPLTIAAGVLFGPAVGTLLVVLGASIGATGAFVWGRRLGRDAVARVTGRRFERVDDWLGDRGLLAVLYLRLVPIVPFNLFNPVAGVTGLTLRDFVLGTVIGIVPGTFAYAALGGSFDDPTSPVFLTAVALLVVLAVGAPVVDRRIGSRED